MMSKVRGLHMSWEHVTDRRHITGKKGEGVRTLVAWAGEPATARADDAVSQEYLIDQIAGILDPSYRTATWEASKEEQDATRLRVCAERRKQWGDDDCDRDGSCDECSFDMAEAHETEQGKERRAKVRETAARIAAIVPATQPEPVAAEHPVAGEEDLDRLRGKIGEALEMGLDVSASSHDVAGTVETLLGLINQPAASVVEVGKECQSVWRCAIGDAVSALDILKNRWVNSRRKNEREAGAVLSGICDLIWAARDPAPKDYSEAFEAGRKLVNLVRTAAPSTPVGEG